MFELSTAPIEIEPRRRALMREDAGGYCAFEGWVRNHHLGKEVVELTYEAYAPLALKQGRTVLDEARKHYDILDTAAVHRIGDLRPGELAVWVGVCAAHRDAAFEACRAIIDDIKATVPIWKHECYADGSKVWVDPADCGCAKNQRSHSHA